MLRKSIIAIVFTIGLISCSNEKINKQFDQLSNEFLQGYYQAYPISATWIGVHDYDGRLDDNSPDAIQKEIERLKSFKKKLGDIYWRRLEPGKSVDYRILMENIDEGLFGLEELRSYSWDPLVYTGVLGSAMMNLITQEFAPLDKRMQSSLDRVKAIPVFIEQAKGNLKDAPKIHIETAIKQNMGNINILKEDLPKACESLTPEFKKQVKEESAKAITALEGFGKFLKEELLPRSTKDFRLGKELFEKKLKHVLKSNIAPAELLQRAEDEKTSVQNQMFELAKPLYQEYFKKNPEKNVISIKKGEAIPFETWVVNFEAFDMGQQHGAPVPSGKNAGDIRVGAKLQILKGHEVYKVVPAFVKTSEEMKDQPAMIPNTKIKVTLVAVDAENKMVAVRFEDPDDPTVQTNKLEVIRAVLDKIVLEHSKPSELVQDARKYIKDLADFVKQKDLLTLDDNQPLEIRVMPEYMRGVAVAFCESPGPLEKNLKSYYDIMPMPSDWKPEQVESFLREYNRYSLQNLSIHEGMPGHYVQGYYSNRYLSVLRSVFASGPMVEGWAVYAERFMTDSGWDNNDPRMKMIQLKWYLRAVMNTILDQKIHSYGMTEQNAMEMMTGEGFQEQSEAAGKWRRACLSSAQLSTYFAGFQEIWDLRKDWEKKKDKDFKLKEFNERFLSYGSPSVKYIREMMLGK